MNDANYLTIVERLERSFDQHGDSHLGVAWPKAEDAQARYGVMLDIIDYAHAQKPVTLLDFGCGCGHLLEFLIDRGIGGISYSGLDASPKFIELCKQKFPEHTFHHVDVLKDPEKLPAADFIIMNGVLTVKAELSFDEMLSYTERLLEVVFGAARCGLAFNVMSKHVDWERDDLFHLPYDRLAPFLRSRLSRHFTFRADYGLFEYTTYVFRAPNRIDGS